jgi:hypothetical protein
MLGGIAVSVTGLLVNLVHCAVHRHMQAEKEGIGQFVLCVPRGRKHGTLMFRPDLDGAGWHEVPQDTGLDTTVLFALGTPQEVMAAIRASGL